MHFALLLQDEHSFSHLVGRFCSCTQTISIPFRNCRILTIWFSISTQTKDKGAFLVNSRHHVSTSQVLSNRAQKLPQTTTDENEKWEAGKDEMLVNSV
jgi:hypothetical protein